LVDSNPNVPTVASPKPILGVKAATPQYLDFEDPVDFSPLNIAIFERLGAQELINIVRHDLISGQKIDYQPVRGISRSGSDFSPLTLASLQGTSDILFKNFSIALENKIPYTQLQPVQLVNNDIVVSVVNLEPDEQVEVQILTFGELQDDTIYEEES